MSKRAAAAQLTKDNYEDASDLEDVGEDDTTFANEMAARQKAVEPRTIRKLVRPSERLKRGTAEETNRTAVFSGFSGFGKPATSAAVTSVAPVTAPVPAPSAPVFASFQPPTSTPSFQAFNPSVSTAPTTAAPVTSSFVPFKPPTTTSASPKVQSVDAGLEQYYTKLRGLNVSFKNALQKAMEKDPLADLNPLFEQYQKHRQSIAPKEKLGDKVTASASVTTSSTLDKTLNTTSEKPLFVAPVAAAAPVEAPKPSFTFAQATSVTSAPSKDISIVSISNPSFTFPSSAPVSSSTKDVSSVSVEAPKASFTFGQPAPVAPGTNEVPKTSFTFGQAAPTSTFTFGAKTSDPATLLVSSTQSISNPTEENKEKSNEKLGLPTASTNAAPTFTFANVKEAKEIPSFTFKLGKASEEPKTASPEQSINKPVEKNNENPDSSKSPKAPIATPTFTFGNEAKAIPSFTFNPGKTSEEPKIVPPPAPAAPTFTFGSKASEETKAPAAIGFTFGTKPSETQSGTTFTFGSKPAEEAKSNVSAMSFSVGGKTGDETKTPSAPSFTFGATASSDNSKSVFGSKPSEETSAFKPSFGFGAASVASSAPAPFTFNFGSAATAAAAPALSFGVKPANDTVAAGDDDDDAIPEGESDSFLNTRTNTEQLRRGAGEEEETTQHEVRAKLFMFTPSAGNWSDLGIGVLKVNKNEKSGSRRLLMRGEGTGRVQLNVALTEKLPVERPDGKREVHIISVGTDGKPCKYSVRVKTDAEAAELLSAIKNTK